MSSDVIRTLKWVFGKGGLIEEYKRQEQMLEETPKSVASMTRIFAPQISRDFPGMNLEQFEALAQQQLVAALQAVSAGNLESVARASDELKEQVSRQIEGNRAAGVRETYEQIRIHQTEISNYEKKNGTCVITFQSAVEHYHYKEKAGKIIWGYKDRKLQTKYNMELLYVQDAAQQTEGSFRMMRRFSFCHSSAAFFLSLPFPDSSFNPCPRTGGVPVPPGIQGRTPSIPRTP